MEEVSQVAASALVQATQVLEAENIQSVVVLCSNNLLTSTEILARGAGELGHFSFVEAVMEIRAPGDSAADNRGANTSSIDVVHRISRLDVVVSELIISLVPPFNLELTMGEPHPVSTPVVYHSWFRIQT